MTGSQPHSRSPGRLRALLGAVRDDLPTVVAAVVVFSTGGLATFLWLRAVAWSALKADLSGSAGTIVAVTPWEVILLQATVALAVGLVFALGALAGYEQVFPVVVEALGAGGQWSIVGLGRVAAVVAVVSGLAAQAVLVAAVLAYGRGDGRPAASDPGTH